MIRSILFVLLIGAVGTPAYAKGGGGDIAEQQEKLRAELEQTRDKNASKSPSIFDLIFGGDKKSDQSLKQQ